MLRIPSAVHFDPCSRAVDVAQIVRRQLNLRRTEVLLESIALRCSWNRHDPGLLRQQPGQCDLCRCGLLPFCERLQPLDESEIRFAIVLCEPWHHVPEVGRIECGFVVDPPGEKSLAERTERHESD